MPGLLQDLAPPHLRARVLAALTIAAPFALAISPMATGLMSSLIDRPRDILLAMTIVNLPSLTGAAILISLARQPYASTVRPIRLQFSKRQACRPPPRPPPAHPTSPPVAPRPRRGAPPPHKGSGAGRASDVPTV